MSNEKKKPKFLRRDWYKKSKLGKHRKKKQIWRKQKGRHGKIRLEVKGKSKKPKIGYSRKKDEKGRILGLKPILIKNIQDLQKIKKDELGIISKGIGKLKRAKIAEKVIDLKIKLGNFNPEEFLEALSKEKEKRKELKKVRKEKKKKQEKKKAEKKEEKKQGKEEKVEEKTEEKREEEEREEKKEKEKILHKQIPKDQVKTAIKPKATPIKRMALEK